MAANFWLTDLIFQWIINVCYTVIGERFSDFVRAHCEARNTELADKCGLNIEVEPEILKVIQSSTAVATMKGNSVNLLKLGSKRRRTKAELEVLHQMEDAK